MEQTFKSNYIYSLQTDNKVIGFCMFSCIDVLTVLTSINSSQTINEHRSNHMQSVNVNQCFLLRLPANKCIAHYVHDFLPIFYWKILYMYYALVFVVQV